MKAIPKGKGTRPAKRIEAAAGPTLGELDAAFGRLLLHYGRAYNACEEIDGGRGSARLRAFCPQVRWIITGVLDAMAAELEPAVVSYAAAVAAAGFPVGDEYDEGYADPDAAFGRLMRRFGPLYRLMDYMGADARSEGVPAAVHESCNALLTQFADAHTPKMFDLPRAYAAGRDAVPATG